MDRQTDRRQTNLAGISFRSWKPVVWRNSCLQQRGLAAQCLGLCSLEAGQNLDHLKLASGLWDAFFTGSLGEATNYASHGPRH